MPGVTGRHRASPSFCAVLIFHFGIKRVSFAAMKIHEYQARKILGDSGIPAPRRRWCGRPNRRWRTAGLPRRISSTCLPRAQRPRRVLAGEPVTVCVVKAQVYAGGRGKAGFVKLVQVGRRGPRRGRVHAHPSHGQRADRRRRRAGVGAARRAGRGHRQGVLPRHHRRSRPRNTGDDDRLGRGRRGDRGGRPQVAREGPQGAAAPAAGAAAVPGPRAGVPARLHGQAGQRGRRS